MRALCDISRSSKTQARDVEWNNVAQEIGRVWDPCGGAVLRVPMNHRCCLVVPPVKVKPLHIYIYRKQNVKIREVSCQAGTTTGYKGVGWKSVFRVCETPHVPGRNCVFVGMLFSGEKPDKQSFGGRPCFASWILDTSIIRCWMI